MRISKLMETDRLIHMNVRLKLVGGVSTVLVLALFVINLSIRKFPLTRRIGSKIEAVIGRFWGIVLVRAAGLRVNVSGGRSLNGGPFMVVANHTSMLDIPILLVALNGMNFRFLAAKELFQIKIFGKAMRFSNHIPFDRSDPRAMVETYDSLNDRCFRHGQSVAVFPEGTRGLEIIEFGERGFITAIRDSVNLLPIRIWISDDSSYADVLIGEPISTDGMKRSDGKRLSENVREWVVSASSPNLHAPV